MLYLLDYSGFIPHYSPDRVVRAVIVSFRRALQREPAIVINLAGTCRTDRRSPGFSPENTVCRRPQPNWADYPATIGDWRQAPVPLDEFQDRDVVAVIMHQLAVGRKWRHYDHGDAGAGAEEIERPDIARIVEAAANIDAGLDPETGVQY
jgi:hypothetical protein